MCGACRAFQVSGRALCPLAAGRASSFAAVASSHPVVGNVSVSLYYSLVGASPASCVASMSASASMSSGRWSTQSRSRRAAPIRYQAWRDELGTVTLIESLPCFSVDEVSAEWFAITLNAGEIIRWFRHGLTSKYRAVPDI